MPRISDHFKLDKTQAELDFVNINTNKDTRLYVDPYAIEIRDDELSDELKFHITTFFEDVLKSLRKGDATRAQYLTENLHEPRETFLGVSKGKPRGRGVGREQADKMLSKLTSSRAYKTGLLTDLAETGLFIKKYASRQDLRLNNQFNSRTPHSIHTRTMQSFGNSFDE